MTINLDRNKLLSYLPSNGVCAEIGVAKGKFSLKILKSNNPKKLYLIDSWENFDLGYSDGNMVEQDSHDIRYLSVVEKMKKYSQVEIIRKRSTEASCLFPDNFFDWIYIDADHSFQGCYTDLVSFLPKIKKNGFICGHDYLADGFQVEGFGVNLAVHTFVKEYNLKLLGLTNEKDYKSYVLGTAHAEKIFTDQLGNFIS